MLDRLLLDEFRNHRQTVIEGTERFNLLVGENGAGKTNVLEAISLLAPGRGLRRAALPEMVRQGSDRGFAISADLAAPGGELRLGTGIDPRQPGRRLVKVNGSDTPALQLSQWLGIGWLTPAMDRLFAESAGTRRRFLDRLILAVDPAHARMANRLETALRERNRLLSGESEPDPIWLDAVEAQLAEAGSHVAEARARMVESLGKALHRSPDAPFARPLLAYAPGGPVAREALAETLAAGRARDRAAQRTLAGPHRDELVVTMAGKNMAAAECSTGEQKAMLIAIILAHAGLAEDGRPQLLLLDEVAAHLDPLRRAALFERLRAGSAQVWLTGTEPTPFADITGEAAIWQVSDGAVRRL